MGGCFARSETKIRNRDLEEANNVAELVQFFNNVVRQAEFKEPSAKKLLKLGDSLIELSLKSSSYSIGEFLRICEHHKLLGLSNKDFNLFINHFTVHCFENNITSEPSREALVKMARYLSKWRILESPSSTVLEEHDTVQSSLTHSQVHYIENHPYNEVLLQTPGKYYSQPYLLKNEETTGLLPIQRKRHNSVRLGDLVPTVPNGLVFGSSSQTRSKTREQKSFLPLSNDRMENNPMRLSKIFNYLPEADVSYIISRKVSSSKPREISCETSTDMNWRDNYRKKTKEGSRNNEKCQYYRTL